MLPGKESKLNCGVYVFFKKYTPVFYDSDLSGKITYNQACQNVAMSEISTKEKMQDMNTLNTFGICPGVDIVSYFAEAGDLEMIIYLKKALYPWDSKTVNKAAQNGHMHIVKYAIIEGCPFSASSCAYAARGGHLEILKCLKAICSWTKLTTIYAAKAGRLEILKFARENGCIWDSSTFKYAVENGDMEIIKYLIQENCPHNHTACTAAASKGDLDLLKFLIERGFEWGPKICEYAAEGGHMHILDYVVNQGCIIPVYTINVAAKNGHLNIVKNLKSFINTDTFSCAAMSGNIDMLEWLLENNCPWHENICSLAAYNGHLDALIWLRNHGAPWGIDTASDAISSGRIDILKYVIENGCPLSARLFDEALSSGDIEMLILLQENNCPRMENYPMCRAVSTGNLNAVKWAVQNGFIWNADASNFAASNGYLDILIWAEEEGYDVVSSCKQAIISGHLEVFLWALEKGYPYNKQRAFSNAIRGCNVKILDIIAQDGCEPVTDDCYQAVRFGRLDILKHLVDGGVQMDELIILEAIVACNLEILIWATERGCPKYEHAYRLAIIKGSIDVINYLYSNGYPWSEGYWDEAIKGTKQVFDCLADKNFDMDVEKFYINAAKKGKVEIFKWAISRGYKLPTETCIDIMNKYGNDTLINFFKEK